MNPRVEVLRFPDAAVRHSSERIINPGDFVIEEAWGVTVDAVSSSPEFARGAPIGGILDLSGEWWCVAKSNDGRRLVFSDRFGMQPLALTSGNTIDGPALFVGTSAAATARAVRAAGGNLETNWAYVLETIGAKHDFLDCVFDFSTPTNGVMWLPPDQAVEVGDGGYRIVPRPTFQQEGTYQSLLEEGIERAIADVQRLVDTHERVAINLSGGKDSRVVLAVVLAAGCRDRVQVLATDPTPPVASLAHGQTVQDDLVISSRLVEGLGLSWVDWRSPRDLWPTNLEGELDRFQYYRHGLTNQFLPLGLAYRIAEPEARINGAGGEIFREYWSHVLAKHPVWANLGHTAASKDADARRLLQALRSGLTIPADLAEQGETSFVEGVNHLSDGTLAQALDLHYEMFRMRGHAGGRRWGQTYGITNFSLLQQATLSRAAQKLDPVERDGGKVLFDIVERVMPELNDLEYQSGPWPWSGQRPPVRDWATVKGSIAGFRQAQQRAKNSTHPSRYRGRPRPDMSDKINVGLRALVDQMRTDGVGAKVLDPILQSPPKDLRGQGRMLARLFNWASGFGDERLCPLALSSSPPLVRTYSYGV